MVDVLLTFEVFAGEVKQPSFYQVMVYVQLLMHSNSLSGLRCFRISHRDLVNFLQRPILLHVFFR